MANIFTLLALALLLAIAPARAGQLSPSSPDIARAKMTGTFSATGTSPVFADPRGLWNLSLSGFGTATVRLERSFDGGTTWKIVQTYSASAEEQWSDGEPGMMYRLNCTAFTSGPIAYRLSR